MGNTRSTRLVSPVRWLYAMFPRSVLVPVPVAVPTPVCRRSRRPSPRLPSCRPLNKYPNLRALVSHRTRGVSYKYTACPDYDACESCFCVSEEVHPGHSFAKVYKQGDIIVRKSAQSGFRHHAQCDVCHKQILGVRYKCIHPTCPDFDICGRCEVLPFAVHPDTHVFVKLKSHISSYDGLRNIFDVASGREQASQPQFSIIRVPVPVVRIPTPRLHI
ncbi:ZZ type zinc finger protein, partial [Rhizoctonia solani AG-3 Rhs1AP]